MSFANRSFAHVNRRLVHASRSIALGSFEAVHPTIEVVRARSSTASSNGSIVLTTGSIAVPIDRREGALRVRSKQTKKSSIRADGLLERTARFSGSPEREEEPKEKSCERAARSSMAKDGLRKLAERLLERKKREEEQPEKKEAQPSSSFDPPTKSLEATGELGSTEGEAAWTCGRFIHRISKSRRSHVHAGPVRLMSAGGARGSVKRKCVLFPGSLSTQSRPPCASTMPRQM